jgi:G3E family GTPase
VPLIIVTGFLGAGKTTLVNRILKRRAERMETTKLGIVVNELGAVGIDGALLGGQGDESPVRQVELPGGCVCCVLSDDLDKTLLELVASNPGMEAIVLETTGVAEPLPIAWAARREPVASAIRLAAVVTLVDATSFVASRDVSDAVDAQVAYADVLFVTKAELAGEAATAEVIGAARDLAPKALVRTGTTDEHAQWLEEALRDPSVVASAPVRKLEIEAPTPHVHDETCRHTEHGDHGIDSVWIGVSDDVDLEELSDQLTELPDNYVRIKGILLAVDESAGATTARWTAVHRVGLRVSSEPVDPPNFQEGRIVALGPGVSADELAAAVHRAKRP